MGEYLTVFLGDEVAVFMVSYRRMLGPVFIRVAESDWMKSLDDAKRVFQILYESYDEPLGHVALKAIV